MDLLVLSKEKGLGLSARRMFTIVYKPGLDDRRFMTTTTHPLLDYFFDFNYADAPLNRFSDQPAEPVLYRLGWSLGVIFQSRVKIERLISLSRHAR